MHLHAASDCGRSVLFCHLVMSNVGSFIVHSSLYLLCFGDVTYVQSLLASQMKSLSSTDWFLWLLGSCIGKGAITECL